MAHRVTVEMPPREIGKADVKFSVYDDDGKIGTLAISRGSVVWFPFGTKYGHKMRWAKFAQMMEEKATRFEER